MKLVKLSVAASLAAVLLSGCAAAAVPMLVGGGIGGGMFMFGNKQRSACADLYDRAHKEKWSDAKTKAEGYRAGCR